MIIIRERSVVLKYSLHLEQITSELVAYLLDVKEPKNSLSFGNKSSSLSFNQKLNLLLDNDSIIKEEKIKLEAFSNIRNQFMHNVYANSFTDAFNQIDGLENKMRKLYPHLFRENLESDLEECVEQLYLDGLKILLTFKGGFQRKISLESSAKLNKKFLDRLDASLKSNLRNLENELNLFEGDTINKAKLLEIIKLMEIQIYSDSVLDLL